MSTLDDEDILADDDGTFHTPSSFEYDKAFSTPSPRRKTRSCATPDVLKTRDAVTLDDLLRHGIITAGAKLIVEGVSSNGILMRDGWIEFGADKYPDLEAWLLKLRKRNKSLRGNGNDCWDVVSTKGHSMSSLRDKFLGLLTSNSSKKEKKSTSRDVAANKGRNGITPTKHTHNTESEDDVPHKKRKVSVEKQGDHDSSSLVDVLADLQPASPLLSREGTPVQLMEKRDDQRSTPTSPPSPTESPPELTTFQPNSFGSGEQSPSVLSFKPSVEFHTISSTELGALAAHLDEHAKEIDNFDTVAVPKEKVILGTGMKSQMLATLQTLVAQLGGKLVHDFTEDITHVVTITDAQGHTPRTLKYCSAVLNGAWIVSFDWVLASLAAKLWANEEPYEIKGDQHGDGAPLKARTALFDKEPRLFVDKSFYLVGEFNHPSPSRGDLESLLSIGGATILSALPPLPSDVKQYMETSKYTTIICDPSSFSQEEAVDTQMACSLIPISYTWVLDSISAYELKAVDSYKFVPDNSHNFETQQSLAF